MRREGRELWLKPSEWILWVMANRPERIASAEERRVLAAAPIDPRVDAQQWRAGTAQGLLKRTSPLRGELSAKGLA
jgi:hypothetical protein